MKNIVLREFLQIGYYERVESVSSHERLFLHGQLAIYEHESNLNL